MAWAWRHWNFTGDRPRITGRNFTEPLSKFPNGDFVPLSGKRGLGPMRALLQRRLLAKRAYELFSLHQREPNDDV